MTIFKKIRTLIIIIILTLFNLGCKEENHIDKYEVNVDSLKTLPDGFYAHRSGNIFFDNDKFINDLQVAIGVLNKEGTDYTFPHRSLQEYFAAIYIASLNDENNKKI